MNCNEPGSVVVELVVEDGVVVVVVVDVVVVEFLNENYFQELTHE